jgi:nicotinamide mononucleotide adenylyltransferase
MSGKQAPTASRSRDMILLGIGIGAVARLLGSRRFQVRVITGVIAVAALAGMARESEVPVMVRVIFKDYFTGQVKELMEHGQEELKREELKGKELKRRHHRSSTTKAELKAEKHVAKELDVSAKDVDTAVQAAAGELS